MKRLIILIALLGLAMLTIHVLPAPWSLVRLRSITGGVSILDMEPHYSASAAYARLDALGKAGRDYYLYRLLLGADLILPALMAFTLSAALRNSKANGKWLVLPWLAAAADYVENVLIGIMLVDYPAAHVQLATTAGWVTTTKLALYGASVIAVGVFAVQSRIHSV